MSNTMALDPVGSGAMGVLGKFCELKTHKHGKAWNQGGRLGVVA